MGIFDFLKKTKKRNYEGASKSKRFSRWKTTGSDANSATLKGLVTLRNRARDLRRNNPYAAKGIQVISANVIGHGIKTQLRATDDAAAKKAEKLFRDWVESKAFDFDGRQNIYGMQRLIMDAVVESGEVLIRKRYNANLKVPVQYQILEADFLDTNKNSSQEQNGNSIIQGIEIDKQGRRVAYWLFQVHPGGYEKQYFPVSETSVRVPADEILHIYRQDRPGQARGVSWLAPVIVRIKDLDDYEDAQLVRQKIAACFSVFVRDMNGDLNDTDETSSDLGDKVEPGLIEYLPTGKTVEFANPPEVQNYKEYVSAMLHSIAAGLGVTYETLTGDLSQVNFSSARMGWLEFQRNLQTWRENIIYAHFLDHVAEEYLQFLKIMGQNVEGMTWVHVPPKREMIDPTKEVPSTIEAIRAGLTTLSDEILAQGKDPQEQLDQIAADMKALDSKGIILESDPRVPKDSGQKANEVASNETQQS